MLYLLLIKKVLQKDSTGSLIFSNKVINQFWKNLDSRIVNTICRWPTGIPESMFYCINIFVTFSSYLWRKYVLFRNWSRLFWNKNYNLVFFWRDDHDDISGENPQKMKGPTHLSSLIDRLLPQAIQNSRKKISFCEFFNKSFFWGIFTSKYLANFDNFELK